MEFKEVDNHTVGEIVLSKLGQQGGKNPSELNRMRIPPPKF